MRYVSLGVGAIQLLLACGGGDGSPSKGGATRDSLTASHDPKPQAKPVTEPVVDEPAYPLDESLRLNQIQFKGTHNSYHLEPAGASPDQRYSMPTLTEQLAFFGVRGFELDIHYEAGVFGVYHLPTGDDRTTCRRLHDCLAELKAWSDAHPGHHPLVVFFDPRDQFDVEKVIDHLDELDLALAAVWPRGRIVAPDDVIRGEADLMAGVARHGWPTLGATRGKIMFVLWGFGDIPYQYTREGASLAGRLMFTAATYTGWRHGLVVGMDIAQEQEAQIADAVHAGYFVRTRSDDLPTRGASYPERLAAALRSGAQAILTDYPRAGDYPDYVMTIPEGTPSRCNPQTAPAACAPADVESARGLSNP